MKHLIQVTLLLLAAAPATAGCATTQSAGQSAGEQFSDSDIAARVSRRLSENPHVKAFEIDVEVDTGTVYLSGVVESHEAKAEAGRIAANTDGVVAVENQLTVAVGEDEVSPAEDDMGNPVEDEALEPPEESEFGD